MDREVELARGLAEAGLPLIALPGGPESGAEPPSMGDLVKGLAASPDPLFRLALVPLFLCNREARDSARGPAPAALPHLYTAAVCLHHLWKTRLGFHVDPDPPEDYFSNELGLPDPRLDYGRSCLSEICGRFERGEAGPRIRRADLMIAKLVKEMFGILERRGIRATAR